MLRLSVQTSTEIEPKSPTRKKRKKKKKKKKRKKSGNLAKRTFQKQYQEVVGKKDISRSKRTMLGGEDRLLKSALGSKPSKWKEDTTLIRTGTAFNPSPQGWEQGRLKSLSKCSTRERDANHAVEGNGAAHGGPSE